MQTTKKERLGSIARSLLDGVICLWGWHTSSTKKGFTLSAGTARGLGVPMPTDKEMQEAERLLQQRFGDSFVDIRAEVFYLGRTTKQSAPIKFDPDRGRPKRTVIRIRFKPDIKERYSLSF